MAIEQPWNDHRIKLNDVYIGCVTKENADYLIGLERDAEAFRRLFSMPEHQVREELAIYTKMYRDMQQQRNELAERVEATG